MASSKQATTSMRKMHDDIREAIRENNGQLLYNKLVHRLVTHNHSQTALQDQEKSDAIYEEVLCYVCEQYPYPYGDSQSTNAALLNTLRLLMQHISYSPAVILKALEKAAAKSKLQDKQLVLNHLIPIILVENGISEENLIEILLGASSALLNNFLKAQVTKLLLQQKQQLLSRAMIERKLGLVGLLINQPHVFAGVGASLITEFFQYVSSTQNLSFVKALLAKDSSLIASLSKGAQKSLIEAAIDSKDVDLIHVLLSKKPTLFLEHLNNGKLPILYAAKKNLWEMVEAIYASTTFLESGPLYLESEALYQAFLIALQANTAESKKWAIGFASKYPGFICKTYSSDEDENTALHYAMKNRIEEVVKIILNKENYTPEGASIDKFIRQENSNKNTAIGLTANQQQWEMVGLHAELYQPKTLPEWNKLYKVNVDNAIKAKSQNALLAAMALLEAFPKEASPEPSWIIDKIKDLMSNNLKEKSIFKRIGNVIFNEKIEDSHIQGVLSRLLRICESEERLNIISNLSRNLSFSLGEFTKKSSEDPEDIKKNSLDLIGVISIPLVRADVILSALNNQDRLSPVWTKKTDSLYNGTRTKLIEMFNQDITQLLNGGWNPDVKAIVKKMNLLKFEFSEFNLVEGFLSPESSPAMRMCILRDFLNIIYLEGPRFSNSDLQVCSKKEEKIIKAEMVSIYQKFIEPNQTLKELFLKNVSGVQNSAIKVALEGHGLQPAAHPQPSAPPLPIVYTGESIEDQAFKRYVDSLPPPQGLTSGGSSTWSGNPHTHFPSPTGRDAVGAAHGQQLTFH